MRATIGGKLCIKWFLFSTILWWSKKMFFQLVKRCIFYCPLCPISWNCPFCNSPIIASRAVPTRCISYFVNRYSLLIISSWWFQFPGARCRMGWESWAKQSISMFRVRLIFHDVSFLVRKRGISNVQHKKTNYLSICLEMSYWKTYYPLLWDKIAIQNVCR